MKKNWEKILLVGVLVVAGAGAAALAVFFPGTSDILGFTPQTDTGKQVSPLTSAAVEKVTKGWKTPPVWTEPAAADPSSTRDLFIARRFLFYPNSSEVKFDDGNQDYHGIALKWLNKYHIPLSDDVALGDPDGDGFSNFTEFKNGTDPTSKDSHPTYLSRLRLKEYESKPFRIRFNGVNELEGVMQFQLNLLDAARQKSRLVKINDVVEGYTLKAYRHLRKVIKDPTTNTDVDTDVSELDLEREDVGATVTLVLNQTKDAPDSKANFVMLMPGQADNLIRVARGKDFEIPQEPGVKYRLMEIEDKGEAAKIKNLATGQIVDVPKLVPENWSDVPGGDAPAAAATPDTDNSGAKPPTQ